MVARAALDDVERALLNAGWEFEKTDPYDQHYYRAWSHEIPPMRCAGQALELDVHHTILPPFGRLRPNTEALFEVAVPIAGTPFHVLCPSDQVLHAAAHLFQDSDCIGRLRDVVDFDGLVRLYSAAEPDRFWEELLARSRLHQLGRPLWYAVTFARAWLGLPVPNQIENGLNEFCPHWAARLALRALASRTLPPANPDGERSLATYLAGRTLEFRALWLRMPAGVLAYHSAMKLLRTLKRGSLAA
jgi:hypothetical protein